ncbi:ATP synthase F1 subunit delta [Bacteroidota bacterium]
MNDSKISVRYAKALFESALEKNILDEVRQDMIHLHEICKLEEFDSFLRSPIMKESQKRKVIGAIVEDKVQSLTMGLIDLVLKNNRELYIPGIARKFEVLYKKNKGIKSAVLVSAYSVDSNLKERVSKILKDAMKSKIDLTTEKNKELIGGFVIRIEDQQYDASVASKLKNIEKQLLK